MNSWKACLRSASTKGAGDGSAASAASSNPVSVVWLMRLVPSEGDPSEILSRR